MINGPNRVEQEGDLCFYGHQAGRMLAFLGDEETQEGELSWDLFPGCQSRLCGWRERQQNHQTAVSWPCLTNAIKLQVIAWAFVNSNQPFFQTNMNTCILSHKPLTLKTVILMDLMKAGYYTKMLSNWISLKTEAICLLSDCLLPLYLQESTQGTSATITASVFIWLENTSPHPTNMGEQRLNVIIAFHGWYEGLVDTSHCAWRSYLTRSCSGITVKQLIRQQHCR